MEQVDAELQKEDVPIHARSIRAKGKVALLVGQDIPITGIRREPFAGVYSGIELSIRTTRWYDNRYGERMKVNPSSYSAVMIRDDAYRVKIPYFVGSLVWICDREAMGVPTGPRMRTDGKPVVSNVLDNVEGLTKGYVESLRDEELLEVANRYVLALQAVGAIKEAAKHFKLVPEALANIVSSVNLLFGAPPQPGFSKWESLQATEKVLKSYIAAKGAKYKRTHILKDLALSAELLLLPPIPRAELGRIQCTPDVRYGVEPVTAREAVEAHQAALSVCRGIAVNLLRLKGIDVPVVRGN